MSKNIYNKSKKSIKNNFKENIPIPHFEIHKYQNENAIPNEIEKKVNINLI